MPSKENIRYSLKAEIAEAEAIIAGLQLTLLRHPNNQKLKDQLDKVREDIRDMTKTLNEGFSKEPRWN